MKARDFIINKINDLVIVFPNIRVRYENHHLSNSHFVEVVPNEVYRLNKEYQLWEEEVVFKFIENYPDQNLCFITDDALVGIETIDYEAKGELYDILYSINDGCYQRVDVTNIHTAIYGQSFFPIIIEQPPIVYSTVTGISFNTSNFAIQGISAFATCIDVGRPSFESADEFIYPLAA